MREVRSFLFTLFAVISVSMAGLTGQSIAQRATMSDQALDKKVEKRLRGLSRANVFDHITHQVNSGTVVLSGKVYTLGTINEAVDSIKRLPGVVEVVNNMETLPPSPFDDRIRREAYRSFVSRGPGQYFSTINPDVRIIVEGGRITLEGHVLRQSDSNLLNVLANGVSGTFSVTNNLVVGKIAG
ncbi:MAG: BON domain-containing protein [Pyrinomonadaceae bacterium]